MLRSRLASIRPKTTSSDEASHTIVFPAQAGIQGQRGGGVILSIAKNLFPQLTRPHTRKLRPLATFLLARMPAA